MKTIIANWKMNVSVRESLALARGVIRGTRGKERLPEIVLCAPFVALTELRKFLARSRVQLGAQDVFWEESGAYTGEVSTRHLVEAKCGHVILGHSERRRTFGETDQMVNRKIKAALAAKITPVVCVGEPAEVRRQSDQAACEFVVEELARVLDGVKFPTGRPFCIAYEPIWSISTSFVREATPEEIVAMHELIRTELNKGFGPNRSAGVRLLYGGSVDRANARSFLREPAIEGVLVGGASVKLNELLAIIKTASEIHEA